MSAPDSASAAATAAAAAAATTPAACARRIERLDEAVVNRIAGVFLDSETSG